MPTSEEIKQNVLKLQNAKATPRDIEEYVSLATQEMAYRTKGEFGESVAPQGSLLRKGLKALIPSREEAPAAIGATVGGMFGGGLGRAIGLSALGAGAGEAAKQAYEVGQEKLGFPVIFKEQAPESLGEALKRIGIQSGIGGVSEAFGRALGKMFTPFSRGTTPKIEAGIEAAKSEGIVPPLSARTKSVFPQALERFSETSLFGSKITLQKEEAVKKFGEFSKRVGDEIASDKPPEVTSSLINETLKKIEDSYHEVRNKLYDEALSKIKDEKINLDNTIPTLKSIIERRSGELEPAGLAELKSLLSNLEGKKTESKVVDLFGKSIKKRLPSTVEKYSDLRILRSNLGQKIKSSFNDPATTGIKADLEQLYGAVSRDLDESIRIKLPDMADDIKKVDAFNAQGINTLKSKLFKELSKVSPDNIHKILIKPKEPALAKSGKELLGEDVFEEVKRQWLDNLLAKSTIKKEGEDILSPQKLSSNISKMGDTIDVIFENNKEQYKAFKKLEQISDLLSKGKEVTGGSQTAFLLRAVTSLNNLFTAFSAPLVASESGKKLLSSGFPKADFTVRRSVQPVVNILGQRISDDK